MSQKIYNMPEYVVPVTTQEKFDAAVSAGTVTEGLPYAIANVKCPEIYGNGQVQSTAPTTSTVGAIGDAYVALINGVIRIWECIAVNGTTYTWRERLRDVTLNNTSVIANGVANIPIAGPSTSGVVRVEYGDRGITNTSGLLGILKARDEEIEGKSQIYRPIVPANLDKAVMEGLGNNSLTWSDAYKTSARNTIGAAAPTVIEFLGESD